MNQITILIMLVFFLNLLSQHPKISFPHRIRTLHRKTSSPKPGIASLHTKIRFLLLLAQPTAPKTGGHRDPGAGVPEERKRDRGVG